MLVFVVCLYLLLPIKVWHSALGRDSSSFREIWNGVPA